MLDLAKLWLILPLTLAAFVAVSSAEKCVTLRNTGDTMTPKECVIPFKFHGRFINSCTTDRDGKLWCSHEVDAEGSHVDGRWGLCNMTTCSKPFDESGRHCATVLEAVGTEEEEDDHDYESLTSRSDVPQAQQVDKDTYKPCVFPFRFRGKTYSSCTTAGIKADDDAQVPWCSTKTDETGEHVGDNYGNCLCITPVISPSPTTSSEKNVSSSSMCDNVSNDGVPRGEEVFADGTSLATSPEDCSTRTTDNIVNRPGENGTAGLREFPFMALLGYDLNNDTNYFYLCGGTLINRHYVLTAAHCTRPNGQNRDPEVVRLGEHDLNEDCDCDGDQGICNARPQTIPVERVIKHESYKKDPWQTSNDIALLRLATPARLAPNVIPVCLPIKKDQVQSDLAYLWEVPNLQEGIKNMRKYVTVAGYGRTSSNKHDKGELLKSAHASSSKLLHVEIPVNKTCQDAYNEAYLSHYRRRFPQWSTIINPEMQFCAGERSADSCEGDSGGPLVARGFLGIYFQVGLVSFGPKRCGDGLPGVYTNVASYMDWIEDNLRP